jgi:hypothetical protein
MTILNALKSYLAGLVLTGLTRGSPLHFLSHYESCLSMIKRRFLAVGHLAEFDHALADAGDPCHA